MLESKPIQIEIRFFGRLRETTGKNAISLNVGEGSTLESLVKVLRGKYGREFEQEVTFLINGKNAALTSGLDTLLTPGARISILPYVGGG